MSILKLAIFGNPIAHSLSPWIHTQFANQANIAIEYNKIKVELNQFIDAITQFKKQGGHGFNITLPFKRQAYDLATQITARAETAKAVNTILLHQEDELLGDNTDGAGFIRDVTINLNYSLTGKIITLLGAGGAVRGILHPILLQNPAKIIIANRTVQNAIEIANDFSTGEIIFPCEFNQLANISADVVIDGTSFDANFSLPKNFSLNQNSFCYDLKYSKDNTVFTQWAKKNNAAHVHDGLGMLIEQAAEAFYLWTTVKPETSSVIALARKRFYGSR